MHTHTDTHTHIIMPWFKYTHSTYINALLTYAFPYRSSSIGSDGKSLECTVQPF